MASDRVRTDQAGCVVTLVLNRPEVRNALDAATISELSDRLGQAERDPAVRLVVLAASGSCFSAGADLREMSGTGDENADAGLDASDRLAEMLRQLSELEKPTLARVQGPAIGGGVGLVACCDVAVASERAFFRLSEVQMGLLPAVVGPYLVEALGVRMTRRLMLTSERFDAKQACQWGLVHQVVPHSSLQDSCAAMVRNLLRGAPGAQAACKGLIREIADVPLDDAIRHRTAEVLAMRRRSAEARQGIRSFLDKGRPPWAVDPKGDKTCSR